MIPGSFGVRIETQCRGARSNGGKIMRSFLVGAVLGAFGAVWALGALPEKTEAFLNQQVSDLLAKVGVSQGSDAGETVPNTGGAAEGGNGGGEAFAAADALRRSGVFKSGHLVSIYTCPGMSISNSPSTGSDGKVLRFNPVIKVKGVSLAVAPVSNACLSSGFGPRSGKLHKGLDYHTKSPSQIYAAGAGTIVEAVYRDDFGYMVIIDHGNGVYTRYAHLKGFASGIKAGKSVSGTTKLGPMGNSASYRVPQHLHFELLLGDYDTPAKSFGLEAKDPFAY